MQDPTCLLSSQNAFHEEKVYIKTDLRYLYVYACNKQTKFTENNLLERNSLAVTFYTSFQKTRGQFLYISIIERFFETHFIPFPVFLVNTKLQFAGATGKHYHTVSKRPSSVM